MLGKSTNDFWSQGDSNPRYRRESPINSVFRLILLPFSIVKIRLRELKSVWWFRVLSIKSAVQSKGFLSPQFIASWGSNEQHGGAHTRFFPAHNLQLLAIPVKAIALQPIKHLSDQLQLTDNTAKGREENVQVMHIQIRILKHPWEPAALL